MSSQHSSRFALTDRLVIYPGYLISVFVIVMGIGWIISPGFKNNFTLPLLYTLILFTVWLITAQIYLIVTIRMSRR